MKPFIYIKEWCGLQWFVSQNAVLCQETNSNEASFCSWVGVSSRIICSMSTLMQYFLLASMFLLMFLKLSSIFSLKTPGGKITAKSMSNPLMRLSSLCTGLSNDKFFSDSNSSVLAFGQWCRLVTHINTGFSKMLVNSLKSASVFNDTICFFASTMAFTWSIGQKLSLQDKTVIFSGSYSIHPGLTSVSK